MWKIKGGKNYASLENRTNKKKKMGLSSQCKDLKLIGNLCRPRLFFRRTKSDKDRRRENMQRGRIDLNLQKLLRFTTSQAFHHPLTTCVQLDDKNPVPRIFWNRSEYFIYTLKTMGRGEERNNVIFRTRISIYFVIIIVSIFFFYTKIDTPKAAN